MAGEAAEVERLVREQDALIEKLIRERDAFVKETVSILAAGDPYPITWERATGLVRVLKETEAKVTRLAAALDLFANESNWFTTQYGERGWQGEGDEPWVVAQRALKGEEEGA